MIKSKPRRTPVVNSRFSVVYTLLKERLSLEKAERLTVAREIIKSLDKRDRAAKAKRRHELKRDAAAAMQGKPE